MAEYEDIRTPDEIAEDEWYEAGEIKGDLEREEDNEE
jgi:hypothetical protein